MASSSNLHRSDSPSGALADVPPHERGQEPYSVGPSPQMGANVVSSDQPTDYDHAWPLGAAAPGQEGCNRLTFGAVTRMGVTPSLSPADVLINTPRGEFGDDEGALEPSGAPEGRHFQRAQRSCARDVTGPITDPSTSDLTRPDLAVRAECVTSLSRDISEPLRLRPSSQLGNHELVEPYWTGVSSDRGWRTCGCVRGCRACLRTAAPTLSN